MVKIELRYYLGQMLNQLADLAERDTADDVAQCGFEMRLLAEKIDPQGRIALAIAPGKEQLN